MKIVVLSVCFAIGLSIGARIKRAGGGTAIKIEEASYFISVRRYQIYICGGAFVRPQYVLTAASCVLNGSSIPFEHTRIVSGTDEVYGMHWEHQIANIFPHEGYKQGFSWCNMAVIELSAPAVWHPRQNPISLPHAIPLHNGNATLVIFQIRESRIRRAGLKKLNVKIRNADPIPDVLWDLDPTFYGSMETSVSLSKNDLGAPLIYEDEIVGILSTIPKRSARKTYFVSVFACKTFIQESMAPKASSSSDLTSEDSSAAKRRRLDP